MVRYGHGSEERDIKGQRVSGRMKLDPESDAFIICIYEVHVSCVAPETD